MSVIVDTARAAIHHRRKSKRGLWVEIGKVERRHDKLADDFNELVGTYRQVEEQLAEAGIALSGALEDQTAASDRYAALCVDNERLGEENQRLTAQLARALEANQRYATAVSTEIGIRDTSDIEDRATMPQGIDVRPLREALAVKQGKAYIPVIIPVEPIPAPTAPETVPPPMKLQFAAGASKVTVSGGPRPATA
jgi:hypothetical protein